MFQKDPSQRLSMAEVCAHEWFNIPEFPTNESLKAEFKKRRAALDTKNLGLKN